MKKVILVLLFVIFGFMNLEAQVTVAGAHTSSNGTYTTLKSAFDMVNSYAQDSKSIIININASTTETSSAVLNSGTWTTLKIFPTGYGKIVSGNLAAPLIDLNGADNVTIDGRVNQAGNADLTITNNNISSTAGTSTVRFINDAVSNTVKYCYLKGSTNINSSAAGGIVLFSTTTGTTGNDDNTVSYNYITNAGTYRAVCSVTSIGTAGKENSGNSVSFNNFYDFMNITFVLSAGINIGSNSTGFTIQGNSFYETAPIAPGSSSDFTCININNTGGGYNITGNYIGGSGPNCAGTFTKAVNYNNRFTGIYFNAGTSNASNIQGNKIKNISWSNSSNESFYGICILEGTVNVGTITGNIIGDSVGTGSITFVNTNDNGSFIGMQTSGTGTISVSNNVIGSITTGNAAANGTNFYGINSAGSGTLTISNNLIGSYTTANSIYLSSAASSSVQFCYSVVVTNSGTSNVTGNVIANVKNGTTNASIASSGFNCGICAGSGSNNITGNTIRDLSIACGSRSSGYYASINGINIYNPTTGTQNITGNTIYNLTNSNLSFTGHINGIYYNAGTASGTVANNFITSININNPSATAFGNGICIESGTTTFYNNLVAIGFYYSNSYTARGILDSGGTNTMYSNSVYIGGAGSFNSSYALYSCGNNTRIYKNNLLINARSNQNASGKHYGIGLTSLTNLTIDYNDYYASNLGGVLGNYGGDRTTITDWKSATSQDANSLNANPYFVNADGTSATDYKPRAGLIAVTGTGITTDYSAVVRSTTSPLMGVFEVFPINVSSTTGTLSANYTSLKDAFNAINAGTHKGVISVKINNNTSETSTSTLNASGTGSASYTLLSLYPTATGLSITGNLAAPLIDLSGADSVTIDGRVNQTGTSVDLTISNISTSSTAGTSTIRFINDAKNNTVKYCNLKGSETVPWDGGGGVVLFSTTNLTTGNDWNNITNNNITNAGGNRPYCAVTSLGTSAKENSGITIISNNIYDFLNHAGTNGVGVNLYSYNINITVSNNSFYESGYSYSAAGTGTAQIIYVGSGDNHVITGNYIGGSSANCTGNAFVKTVANNNTFYGINISAGTTTASSIQGNTIKNINWINSSFANFYAINMSAGSVNIGTTTGNTIGSSTGTGSVILNNYAHGGYFYGINAAATGPTSISNNTIGAVTTSNNQPASTHFYGIYTSGSGAITVSGNTLGSTSQSGSINLTSVATATWASQICYGFYITSSGANTITNNTIANLINGSTNANTTDTSKINGMYVSSGTNTITGNTIRNLTIANANTSSTIQTSVSGIIFNNTVAAADTISSNLIYNLSNTNSTFAGYIYGLYYNGGTTASTVSSNFINSLTVSGNSGAFVNGIKIIAGATTYSNNIISIGSNTATTIYGIFDAGGTNTLYFNTVYIGGVPSTGTYNSYALYNTTATTRNYRNNLLVNARSNNTATGKHYAIGLTSTTTINYNNYWVSGTGGFVGVFNGTDKSTYALWKSAVPADASSLNTNPTFRNAGGGTAADYKTGVALNGVAATGITIDYSGSTRAATPTIGAFEYVSYPISLTATIGTLTGTYTTLKTAFDAINLGTHKGNIEILINGNVVETATAVLYASGGSSSYNNIKIYPTIANLSVTGTLPSPLIDLNGANRVTIDGRINYTGTPLSLTIANLSNSSTAGTSTIRLINGASSNTINYCNLKGSSLAAPSSEGGIIMLSTSTGTTGNSSNIITYNNFTNAEGNRPYTAIASLGSSSYINTTNTITYNTFYDFLNLSSSTTASGISILSNSTNFTISNNSFYETSSYVPSGTGEFYCINIDNASGNNFTVNTNSIGGSSSACGSTAFTKTSGNNNNFYGISLNAGTTTASNIHGNAIKNINWSNSGAGNFYGIKVTNGLVNVGSTVADTIGSTSLNGSILFTNAASGGFFNGIYSNGLGAKVISKNKIGGITTNNASANSTNFYGIYSLGTGDLTAANNFIGSSTTPNSINLSSVSSGTGQTCYGILINSSGAVTVSGDTIVNITNNSSNSGSSITGIYNNSASVTGTYSKNFIRSLYLTQDAGASVYGIKMDTGTTAYSNNIVTLDGNASNKIYGIYDAGGTNTLYFNTVYIGGIPSTGSNSSYSMYSGTINIRNYRNNLFVNARSYTGGKQYAVCLVNNTAASINYNNYYASGSGGILGVYNSLDYVTLANWKTATGKDTNSVNINPLFVNAGGNNATDYNPGAMLVGVTGTGITIDYNGATRLAIPSIGAWEFTNIVSVTATVGTATGSYTTLKAAFDAINAGTHKGIIEVKINGSTIETSNAGLSASGGSVSYTYISIYPTATGLSITGNISGSGLIFLNGADNVCIDGRVNRTGNADLTISNSNTGSSSYTSTIRIAIDATYDTVKYCYIKGSSTTTYTNPGGTVYIGTYTSTTGNDNNVIEYNNITNEGGNRPYNALVCYCNASVMNNGIKIRNNNFYDNLNLAAAQTTCVNIYNYCNDITIANNSFYETSTIVPSGAGTAYFICLNSTMSDGINVTGNYIGGSSPLCSGTLTKTSANNNTFYAIYANLGTTSSTEIQGNIIKNISWSNSANAAFYGIYIAAGLINVGNTAGNTIGSTSGTGSISLTNATSGGLFYGIYGNTATAKIISNNVIGSITTNNASANNTDFYGIYTDGAGACTISNNTIGSNSDANSINLSSASTSSDQKCYGMKINSTAANGITGNVIANMTNGTTNTGIYSNGTTCGINVLNGTNTIQNNTIRDLKNSNINPQADNNSSVIGLMHFNSSTVSHDISSNTIYNLSNDNASFAGNIVGIYFNCSSSLSNIYKNTINSFSVNSNSSNNTITGIEFNNSAATNTKTYNNMISLGGNTATNIYGIYDYQGTNSLYYNSVYINGTPTIGSTTSYALYSYTTNTGREFKNNLFLNVRSNAGSKAATGNHYAILVYSKTGLTINYNDYYASGTGGVLGYFGGDKTTLADWKTATSQDVNSSSSAVTFLSETNLRVTGSSIGDGSLSALPISQVTLDIDNTTRSVTSPYMGSHESNSPLSVELESFTVNVTDRKVTLKWKTISEINNAGFEVERAEFRSENLEYRKTGFITGKGTTNTPANYIFEDNKLSTGKYKYRLKQTDYNGNYAYYNLAGDVEVGVPTKYEMSQNYPNPFNPMTKIDFQLPMDGKVSLKIYDITGREIATLVNNEFKKADYYTVMFNGSSLSSGVYFYRITADKYVMTKKMVLLK
ncbi:MAG: T9SS type A sorting domain-containing protein [Ignavibacteriae bacterium]|nr:T9SS type A sorting domain-containing protein [Ignavibacteriota bacterium]